MMARLSLVVLLAVTVSAQTDTSRELFRAIQRGSLSEIERLVTRGANANVADGDGVSALMVATLFGDARTVELLLRRGADANRAGASGTTPLMWAMPDEEKVRVLLARGANVNARSETGRTPLLIAASYPGTVGVLRLLLDRGADIRASDAGGASALALAVRSADVEVVRFLIDRGLDPNTLTPVARRVALARYDLPTTEYLVSKGLSPTPEFLTAASTWQPTPLVARLIRPGVDVNASNAAQYGRTALLTAVTSEAASAETVKLLLDHGANPNARTTEDESALDWATYKGDRAKIQILEQHGATRGNGPRQEAIPPAANGGISDPRVSLTRSVARLLDAAPGFRERTGCISCHHNAMPAWAAAAARGKGIEFDEVRAAKNTDDILTFFKSNMPRMMTGDPAVGGEALTAGYALLALAAGGHPSDTVTAAMMQWIMARQMPDGRWVGNGLNRPPSEYSSISHTAVAAGGLKSYSLPARQSQVTRTLRRARQWLLAAKPGSAEERAMRLMGLVWTDAGRSDVTAAVGAVRATQESSGGWSQFGRTEPDAYATGLSLYALQVAGVAPADETYRKGVAFLLGTQYQDGAWLVRTHSFPVQRYFESGFPFGRHQWISSAGTSWATLAIARTLPDAAAVRPRAQ
jgi:ankyrin repeat protein